MKTKIIVGILVLGLVCLSGCKGSKAKGQKQNEVTTENSSEESNRDESNTDESKVQVYREPTEEELQILEDCNLSNDSMRKIKEEGMNIGTQSFVDTAKIMLNYLREKYGEEFKVVGGEIPGIISGDYSILAEAVDGEHSGEQFEVYYLVDDAGNPYCEDGYFAILKSAEFQQMMQERADATGEGWKVFAVLDGTYGEKYKKDTILSENDLEILQGEVRCVMKPEKSEEEYEQQKEELEQVNSDMSGIGKNVNILYCQMLKQEEYDKLQTFEDFMDVLLRHNEKTPLYKGGKWS